MAPDFQLAYPQLFGLRYILKELFKVKILLPDTPEPSCHNAHVSDSYVLTVWKPLGIFGMEWSVREEQQVCSLAKHIVQICHLKQESYKTV